MPSAPLLDALSVAQAPCGSAWRRLLISLVAPARCARCSTPMPALSTEPFCASCTPSGHPQLIERSGLPMIAGGVFEGPLRDAILRLKYHAAPELAGELAAWLAARLAQLPTERAPHAGPPPLLIPVPLHPTRLVQRGYNQAGLLAVALQRPLGLRARVTGLARARQTEVQAELSAPLRRTNVRGAFIAREALRGQRVILVDDVATTGNTLSACRDALHDVGALPLGALVLAHAEHER